MFAGLVIAAWEGFGSIIFYSFIAPLSSISIIYHCNLFILSMYECYDQ